MDSSGHLVHIDFGFVFTNSPGGNAGFESAPFKLTNEFLEVTRSHGWCRVLLRARVCRPSCVTLYSFPPPTSTRAYARCRHTHTYLCAHGAEAALVCVASSVERAHAFAVVLSCARVVARVFSRAGVRTHTLTPRLAWPCPCGGLRGLHRSWAGRGPACTKPSASCACGPSWPCVAPARSCSCWWR